MPFRHALIWGKDAFLCETLALVIQRHGYATSIVHSAADASICLDEFRTQTLLMVVDSLLPHTEVDRVLRQHAQQPMGVILLTHPHRLPDPSPTYPFPYTRLFTPLDLHAFREAVQQFIGIFRARAAAQPPPDG